MPLFAPPFAQLDLVRQPEQDGEPLQAFDAADEYLLNQLHERGVTAQCRVLVLNDAFGALAASLAPHVQVTSSGDSHLGFLALRKNLARNGLDLGSVRFVPASETAVGPFDHVLVKVPKTLALLEEQLIRLHGQLAPGAQVVAAGMVKHLPRAAGDLLERYIGEQPPLTLLNHANVFCREGLDIGTRAFLPHLPRSLGALRAADLGCGNGVLGIAYALLNPQAELTLVDESYMAVQSARENWRAALGERPATFRADDGLVGQAAGSLDLVLCNPPFHQQQVVGDFLAWRMFLQARDALAAGGELWIVGNRHLGYHAKLKRLFRGVEQVAANPKFVILKAGK
ncbi:methyltransferase [Pseudomonas aeruginosa]|uniref:methyltransferase n=1 Tax=Pseudomonas aeruginosa TaxID=287 RepID=UPI001051EE8C|nr:class I SAM-dependent methyltransferase [Pseudomonas aeruginosa]